MSSGIVVISPFLPTLMAMRLIIPNVIFIYFLTQNTTVVFTLNSHFKVHILTFTFPLCLSHLISLFFNSLSLHPDHSLSFPSNALSLSASPFVLTAVFYDFSFLFLLCILVLEELKIRIKTCLLQTMISFTPQRALGFPDISDITSSGFMLSFTSLPSLAVLSPFAPQNWIHCNLLSSCFRCHHCPRFKLDLNKSFMSSFNPMYPPSFILHPPPQVNLMK